MKRKKTFNYSIPSQIASCSLMNEFSKRYMQFDVNRFIMTAVRRRIDKNVYRKGE